MTRMTPLKALALLFASVSAWSLPVGAYAESIVHDKDRIVFCGDSITGLGGKGGANGWVGLIKEGLAIAHPEGGQVFSALGGSGSTVGAWMNFEKKSRDNPVFLDVPNVDVKATLDGGADVLVIMLGMNDVLAPSLKDTPADFDAWAARYHDLIEVLKARTHPRVIALATITPCTEELNGPKNRVEGELNTRMAALAKQENAIVLPTHEAMAELLAEGRKYKPDFHVTADFVHPNPTGHLAIAIGMLRGMGEGDAAAKLLEKYGKFFRPAAEALPTLSYVLTPQQASPDETARRFTIHYQWTPPAPSAGAPVVVTATLPEGWKATPARLTGASGDFQVSGPLDRLINKVTLNATAGDLKKQTDINIPAGWRIAVGKGKGLGWTQNTNYDPVPDHIPADDLLGKDEAYLKPVAFPMGATPPWQHYIASFNFTGHDDSGSVDMAAVSFFTIQDIAYCVRWIHSDKDRPVDVALGSQTFAGRFSMSVMLDGETLYAGNLSTEPGHKKTVEATLHSGWNRLLVKSSYMAWLWQFYVNLAGKPGDELADLRYTTAPPPPSGIKK